MTTLAVLFKFGSFQADRSIMLQRLLPKIATEVFGAFIMASSFAMMLCSCSNTEFGSGAGSKSQSDKKSESKNTNSDTEEDGAVDAPDGDNSVDSGAIDNGGGTSENSGEIEADTDSVSTTNAAITEDESVMNFCAGHTAKEVTLQLVFPADTTACTWGADGNLTANSAKIAAQQGYLEAVALKNKVASLCSFEIKMQKDFTQYDDDITFVFDGYALAGDFLSRDFLKDTAGFVEESGLLIYDRSKVIGQFWPAEKQWKEEGIEGSFETRQNAATQREGSFNLKLTQAFINKLPKAKLKLSDHEFGFYISGNSNSTDCQHDGFTFDVLVTYIPTKK